MVRSASLHTHTDKHTWCQTWSKSDPVNEIKPSSPRTRTTTTRTTIANIIFSLNSPPPLVEQDTAADWMEWVM